MSHVCCEFEMSHISDIIRELEKIKAEHGDLIVMHRDDEGYEHHVTADIYVGVDYADIGHMATNEEYIDRFASIAVNFNKEASERWFDEHKNEDGKMRLFNREDFETVVILGL